MMTNHEDSATLVLGDQPSSSSSSSSDSSAQDALDEEQEQETVSNHFLNILDVTIPNVVTIPTVVTVPTTNKRTNEEQQEMTTKPPIAMTVPIPTPVLFTIRTTNSIAHDDWVGHRSITFHVDLEHGGEACGVL
jgi:hypothetical protein